MSRTVVASAFTLPRVKTRTSISRLTDPIRTKTWGSVHFADPSRKSIIRNRESGSTAIQGERDGEASGGVPSKNAINPCPMFSLRSKTSNLYSPSKILIDDARLKVMYAHKSREI